MLYIHQAKTPSQQNVMLPISRPVAAVHSGGYMGTRVAGVLVSVWLIFL